MRHRAANTLFKVTSPQELLKLVSLNVKSGQFYNSEL